MKDNYFTRCCFANWDPDASAVNRPGFDQYLQGMFVGLISSYRDLLDCNWEDAWKHFLKQYAVHKQWTEDHVQLPIHMLPASWRDEVQRLWELTNMKLYDLNPPTPIQHWDEHEI